MSQLSKYLRDAQGGLLMFWCPGCDGAHGLGVYNDRGPRWHYNGNAEAPTFTPSVLVRYDGKDADTANGLPSVCHSFVTDGQIRFLDDCTHKLKGQTVPLGTWGPA